MGATEPDVSYPLGHPPLRQQNPLYCPAIPYWATLGTPDTARSSVRWFTSTAARRPLRPMTGSQRYTRSAIWSVRRMPSFTHPIRATGRRSTFTRLRTRASSPCPGDLRVRARRREVFVRPFSNSLTSTDAATESFWPMSATTACHTTSSSCRRSPPPDVPTSPPPSGNAWASRGHGRLAESQAFLRGSACDHHGARTRSSGSLLRAQAVARRASRRAR